jgi:hypothetical protein
LEASSEIGLEVNAEKTNYIVVSRHQNAGQNHNLLISNKSFESVAKQQIKTALKNKFGANSCHEMMSLLTLRPLSKNLKDENTQKHHFICFLYLYHTWSPTLREEHKFRVFENRELRRIFGRKREELERS